MIEYKTSASFMPLPRFLNYLLGICIPEVHELKGIPERESKSMRGRCIFSLLDCGQCSWIVHSSRMAIDSPANDWFLTAEAKQ